MDASQRREVLLGEKPLIPVSSTRYDVHIKLYGVANNPIKKLCKSQPIVVAVGPLTKVDFLDGQVMYFNNIEYIQIDEVKIN